MDDYLVIFVIVALGFVIYHYRDKLFPDNNIKNKNSNNKNNKSTKNKSINNKKNRKVSFRDKVSVKEFTKIDSETDNITNSDASEISNNTFDFNDNITSFSEFSENTFGVNDDLESKNSFGSLNSSMSGDAFDTNNDLDSKMSILE